MAQWLAQLPARVPPPTVPSSHCLFSTQQQRDLGEWDPDHNTCLLSVPQWCPTSVGGKDPNPCSCPEDTSLSHIYCPHLPPALFQLLQCPHHPDAGPLHKLFSLEHDFLPTHLPSTELQVTAIQVDLKLERDVYMTKTWESVPEFSHP